MVAGWISEIIEGIHQGNNTQFYHNHERRRRSGCGVAVLGYLGHRVRGLGSPVPYLPKGDKADARWTEDKAGE